MALGGLFRTMKHHPAVIPVFFFTCCGVVMASVQIVRSLYIYPDVSIRRYSNPHPWLHVKPHENLKYLKVADYGQVKQSERPKY